MRVILSVVVLVFAFLSSFAQDNATAKKAKDDILKLHNDWNEARVKKDLNALEQIFAKEYVFINGNGFMDDRATAIDDQMNTDSIQALRVPDPDDIIVYDDIAILKRVLKNPAGSNFNTIVYVKRNGRWQIALHQTTPLQPERSYKKLAANELQKYTGKYTMNGADCISNKRERYVESESC